MRKVAALAVGALLLTGIAQASASAAPARPAATVDPSSVNLGDQALVRGTGWPARTLVHLELCGDVAIDGSADCDLQGGVEAGVGQDGSFSMLLHVSKPPVPCPCVVWVTDSSTVSEARVPVTVGGVPIVEPKVRIAAPDISKLLQIKARLAGHGSWTAWFGSGSHRTLVLAVRNTGTTPIHDPQLSLSFGKGRDPTGFVAAPALGTLMPGTSQTYTASVPIDAFSVGGLTAKGEISAFGNPAVFRTRVSTYPWGLLVVALVVLQLVLLLVRNLVRRRVFRHEQPPVTAVVTEPVIDLAFQPEPVVDLNVAVVPDEARDPDTLAARARLLAAEAARLAGEAVAAMAAAAHAAEVAARAADAAADAARKVGSVPDAPVFANGPAPTALPAPSEPA